MTNKQFRYWKNRFLSSCNLQNPAGEIPKRQDERGFSPKENLKRKAWATVLLTGIALVSPLYLLQDNLDTAPLPMGGTGAGDIQLRNTQDDAVPRLYRSPTPLAQQAPTMASPLQGFCHPLKGNGYLSQGVRSGTHTGRTAFAYDLAISIGSPVYAMTEGRVIDQEDRYPDNGGGKGKKSKFNYVWLEHVDGHRSAYLHLQQGFGRKVRLKRGSWVRTGQLIGYSGNSGWSTAPHLHIEVQAPGSLEKFTKTVPFSIAENCNGGYISKGKG